MKIHKIRTFFMRQAYISWQENPTLNSLLTTGLPIADIDFPAITICGEGSIQEVNGFHHIFHQIIAVGSFSIQRSPKMSLNGNLRDMSGLWGKTQIT